MAAQGAAHGGKRATLRSADAMQASRSYQGASTTLLAISTEKSKAPPVDELTVFTEGPTVSAPV